MQKNYQMLFSVKTKNVADKSNKTKKTYKSSISAKLLTKSIEFFVFNQWKSDNFWVNFFDFDVDLRE